MNNASNQTFATTNQHAYTSSGHLFLQSSIFAVIQLFGLTGNLMVVTSVLSERHLQTNYYLTVLQLSLCDLGHLVFAIIERHIFPWIWHTGHILQNFGLACKLWQTGVSWFYTSGVYFMVFIGYLRHRSVAKPFQEKLSRKRLNFIIIMIYLFSVLLSLPRFFSLDVELPNQCDEKHHGRLIYNLYWHSMSTLQFLLPMLFLSLLYAKLCYSLHKHSKSMQTCNATQNSFNSVNNRLTFALQRRNAKAVVTGVVIVAIFAISNFPTQIQANIVVYERAYDNTLWLFTTALFYLGSSCLNPYVYALLDDAISASFKRRLKAICCRY